MNERAVRFGTEGNLVGVLAEPEGAPAPDRPALLLYNVGFGHRVGLCRFNVELSRELAARGFLSLRFDLSGQGDSDPRATPAPAVAQAQADLADAASFLTSRRGVQRFAVVAMCSGVDAGWATAARDPRIVAAAFIDGYSYPTLGYHLRNLARRLVRPWTWIERLRRAIRPRPAAVAATPGAGEFFERSYPPLDAFRRDVAEMVRRGTHLLLLFSWRWWYFNHVGQIAGALRLRRLPPRVQVEHWTDANHVFSSVRVRRRLVLRLSDWLAGAFPASETAEAAVARPHGS